MPGDIKLRELRYLAGTTFNTAHTAANDAAWAAGTAIKIRVLNYDDSGLVQEVENDASLQQLLHREEAPHPTIRSGNLKFAMYAEGAESTTSGGPLMLLLSKIMGGLTSPSSRTDEVEAASTTTTVNATSHGASAGIGALVGVPGDGRAGAEFRVISQANANDFTVGMAYSSAPTETLPDAIVFSDVLYFNPNAAQQYVDFLSIGESAEDQIQAIGCQGTFGIENLGANQLPIVTFDWIVGDWQPVPAAERDQLEPGTEHDGNSPIADRARGALFIGDQGSTTRATLCESSLAINPGIEIEPITCRSDGVNGIAGWKLVSCRPTIEFTALLKGQTDPLPGLLDDITNRTDKQLILQFGATAEKCFAVDAPRFHVNSWNLTTVGKLRAARVSGHCGMEAHAGNTAALWRANSPIRLHTV